MENETLIDNNNHNEISKNCKPKFTLEEININRNNCINKLNELLDNYISSSDTQDKANKLCYWLNEYCTYLNYEATFNPYFLKEYKRGDIIKANLGYNVDKELGGLHYCVVLDNKNSRISHTLTVVPLTSVKEDKQYTFPNIFLGEEIYSNLNKKHDKLEKETFKKATELIASKNTKNNAQFNEDIKRVMESIQFLYKIEEEITSMKSGSIARINQIRTISKLRIYNPKKNLDILSGIKLSNKSLDLIDQAIIKLYTKH